MPKQFSTIWDGVEFRQVSLKDAKKLEKADKCQNLSRKFFSATELKTRKQFTGYKTREMRAATVDPAPQPKEEEASKPDISAEDWKDHRKAAADYIGKPYNKTTKAQTIDYMEKNLGLAKT